jgi:hypothetical protein
MNHDVNEDNKQHRLLLVAVVVATAFYACTTKKFVVEGRTCSRCDPDYGSIVTKVMKLKHAICGRKSLVMLILHGQHFLNILK